MIGSRALICSSCLFALAVVGLPAERLFAQQLNPNPLQPSGVGSANDMNYGRGGGDGRGLGRSAPGEENPADTLLKEMNGTNNGRRTGRNAFSPRRRTAGYRALNGKVEGTAIRFNKRGTYEEAIYGSRPGSYSRPAPRRKPG
ncbi:MAG TPA: hypothetical protein VF278_02215 [Pirellulales bacterium]